MFGCESGAAVGPFRGCDKEGGEKSAVCNDDTMKHSSSCFMEADVSAWRWWLWRGQVLRSTSAEPLLELGLNPDRILIADRLKKEACSTGYHCFC